MRSPLAGLVFGVFLVQSVVAMAAGPAEALLRLVPADAGVTLAVEDLRGHSREFFASPLADGLGRLPAVRAWLASDRFRGFQEACRQIEKLVGKPLPAIRDDLLGDAVVLTLRIPVHGGQNDARGMLLIRARDRALLDRLIDGVNAAQKASGELLRLSERARGDASYVVREFPPATRKPAEFYAILDDDTFAWSNSEELVQGVLDRRHGGPGGLGDTPRFRKVRDELPARSAVSLFVDPRFLERVMEAAPKSRKPEDERLATMLGHYVEALLYLGAAIEWRSGPASPRPALILHTEELIDPEKLPPWMVRWAARPAGDPRLARVPAAALAVASTHVDFPAVEELLRALTPSQDQRKLDNLLVVLAGLMLGRDLKSAVLPLLGPEVLAYVEETGEADRGTGLAVVVSVDVDDKGVLAALDNALRTILATYALDAKHGQGQLQLESQALDDATVTALGPTTPLAYAVGPGRLVLGRSAGSVARAFAAGVSANRGVLQLRETYFPGAETFVCADLERLRRFVETHRAAIARRIAAKDRGTVDGPERDLDQAVALMGLFRDAFLTSRLADDARSAHRMLGLTVRATRADQAP